MAGRVGLARSDTGIIIGQARPSGQDGGDPRPARLHALGEDPSTMHLHELFCNAQAQTQPALAEAEIARGMAAGVELREERLEQVLERLGFQADAAILDHDLRLVRRVQPGRQLDLAAVGRELDRVGQQVDQDRADLVGVDLERPQVVGQLDLELEVAGVDERTDLVDDPVDQLGEVDRAGAAGSCGNPRRGAGSACW